MGMIDREGIKTSGKSRKIKHYHETNKMGKLN